MFRHRLDDTPVGDPEGFDQFAESLERDFSERIITNKFPSKLTFYSAGYKYLRDAFENDYCTIVQYVCEEDCNGVFQEAYRGNIILADIDWDLEHCKADASLADDGAGARIRNNRQLSDFPTGTETKNGEEITAISALDIEVFDPTDPIGDYLPTRQMWDWKDAIGHLVASITDNTVLVVSDWYDALDDDERWAVCRGVELRTADGDFRSPELDFTKLFNCMQRPYNLWAAIQHTPAQTYLRIEEEAYFFGTDTLKSYPNTPELIQSMDTDRLYAVIRLGGDAEKNEDGSATWSLPFVGLLGFSKETVNLKGVCNTDNALDLTNPYINDTNLIEQAIGGSDENDDEVFLIQYDQNTLRAVKSDYLSPGTGPYLYNEAMLNQNVLARWPQGSAGFLSFDDTDAAFRAERTVPTVTYDLTAPGATTGPFIQLGFDADYPPLGYDVQNNYGNGTVQGNPVSDANSRYTAPAEGFYQYRMGAYLQILTNDAIGYKNARLTLEVERYDVTNTLVSQFSTGTDLPNRSAPGIYIEEWTVGTQMNVDDYVIVNYQINTNTTPFPGSIPPTTFTVRITSNSFWETTYVATGGGELLPPDPNLYYSTLLKFERHMDLETWNTWKGDLTQQVLVGVNDTEMRIGYLRKAERTMKTGKVEFELLANRDQQWI